MSGVQTILQQLPRIPESRNMQRVQVAKLREMNIELNNKQTHTKILYNESLPSQE